jgi:hypothetical protein
MRWDANALAARRKAVLQQLRERWGNVRQAVDEREKSRAHYLEGYLGPFLEIDAAEADLPANGWEPSETHVRDLLDNLRTLRREQPHPLQQEPEEGGETLAPEQRRDLMAEIMSAHFRSNMEQWLGSANPEQELSSTPPEDLEGVQKEAQYRLSVLKQMVALAEREIDLLELQIRAKRTVNEPGRKA